jgi:serine/threonine-protein kinase
MPKQTDIDSPEQWTRLRSIFDAASELTGRAQAEYLDSATEGDPNLRRQIQALLRASSDAADFISVPLIEQLAPESAATPDSLIGARLGVYRVKRLASQGGYSRIYEGVREDGLFTRRVALKVATLAHKAEQPLDRRRLEREIQLLAELRHPGICQLFDAGFHEGSPYAVLEYVQRGPIRSYAENCKLSIPQKLQVFLDLCDAVRYLHEHGVLHGDLKPSNLLVRHDGSVCLVDFGSAMKIHGDEDGIRERGREITIAYASPELISTKLLSQATEVYAVGMVLYELLAGRYPYTPKGKLLHQLVEAIQYEDPRPPSEMMFSRSEAQSSEVEHGTSPLCGDMDDVTLKAIQKLPEDRYSTVAALAADIRMYLRGKHPEAVAFMREKRISGQELQHPIRVFLAHCAEDKPRVRELRDQLLKMSARPWLDEDDILPSRVWQTAVESGLKQADVVLVCFSQTYVEKGGYLRRELQLALELAAEHLPDEIFLIPVRLDECDLPEEFQRRQRVDLYDENGFSKLLRALHVRCDQVKNRKSQRDRA